MHITVSWPHWYGHGTKAFTAKLKTDTGSPEPIAHSNLHPVFSGQACHFVTPGKHISPVFEIFLGITEHFFLPCGAGRGMDANYLFKRN